MKEIILTCIARKEAHGRYSSLCPELDVASCGNSIEEATKNLKEAVQGHIQTAIKENMFEEILEKLGITEQDLNKAGPISLNSFSTPLSMEIPA
ncbi:MAG TPA: type II toxin-antitoxin system HicB family antitoxin [Candidatus Nanoarchaeia archaeon]|nr:type II toxin-antitoxin system HicB family antitoxin [Candidatus Nanoarchaeia archaeon]